MISTVLNKKTRNETQIKFHKTVAIAASVTYTYSVETWTLATKLGRKVDRAEMRILANVVGYTLKDCTRTN
jgi:hypothetical protein